jgi:zona occludens toxin
MSILISAPIRTGKTLFVMKCIFEELNKGRMVYTNIVGINVEGVISVSSSLGDPFNWADLPNGCALIWDEAHEHPSFSEKDLLKNYELPNKCQFDEIIEKVKLDQILTTTEKKLRIETVEKAYKKSLERKKEEIRDIGAALLMHGHYGIEIYFITQRVTKLNTDVLASVTTHFVMRRKYGMDAAMIWEFGEAMSTWSKSTAEIALNKTLWRYPKHLYKFYKSSENHQVRKSFPTKYLLFALLPISLFLFGFSNAKETGFFGLFGDKEVQVNSKTNTDSKDSSKANDLISKPNLGKETESDDSESNRIASVFDSSDNCRAYSGNGELINVSVSYCRQIANNPRLLRPASDAVRNERLQAINYTQYNTNTETVRTTENNTQTISNF